MLPHPAQQIVLQEYLQTVNERIARLERLVKELQHQVHRWRYYPVVKALQAMRGIRLIVAAGVIAELGAITKCGNSRARRLLIEGAHSYRYTANISEELQKRQEGLPKDIIDIGWKAQLRLCRRYQRLMQRGKHYNLVIAAIAREMIAYIWAIAKEVVLTPLDPRPHVKTFAGTCIAWTLI